MPKRPCPYEADLLPQMKVHVGQRQMNNGASRDERMKDVYGKSSVCFVIQSVLLKFQFSMHISLYISLYEYKYINSLLKNRNLYVTFDNTLLHPFNILFLLNFLDKTLTLLKTGAKALSYKLNASVQMDPIELSPLRQLSPWKLKSTSNLKQMLLTDKLQLKISDKIINVSFVYNL